VPHPLALVIGFTIHGLAVARSLAKAGITVHAFVQPDAVASPCTRTRFARIHMRDQLNGDGLLPALGQFAAKAPADRRIVLFPTSDRIVKTLAENWDALAARYLLSWSHCRDLVLKMQLKSSIPELCELSSVPYPRSCVLRSAADCEVAFDHLRKPLIVKPAQPLSSFKALVVESLPALQGIVTKFGLDLPFVVQEWIEGGEGSLFACTAYLDRGRIIGMFTSRKLAAMPPGTGQGTIFASTDDETIRRFTRRFLADLDLSGPVAVEFKRDSDGHYWLIEPNVGRTEYCVDLAIQSGFDLPRIEYHHACGNDPATILRPFRSDRIWFDTDKDPRCFISNRNLLTPDPMQRLHPVFPYHGHDDLGPVFASSARLMRRAMRMVTRPPLGRSTGDRHDVGGVESSAGEP
jgi:predicted ATP-grasp superfamily ATP-dependent carboligase